jgi:tetratricopeptide (TPR) repeat protein
MMRPYGLYALSGSLNSFGGSSRAERKSRRVERMDSMYALKTDRLHILKMHLSILLGCLTCSLSFAEYRELEVLKQSSRQVLMGYAQRLAAEDSKFEGVVKFGEALQAIKDETRVDIAKLTYQSKNYWRAVLEMTPKDSSILFAHAHLHAACGETDWTDPYFLLGSLTAGKSHRAELDTYTRLRKELDNRAGAEINKGIELHDRGEYSKAIEFYDVVIAEHPNCALAYYEKGLSYMMMGKDDPNHKQEAMQMYSECRRRDPFHWKAYQGSDPNVIRKLQVYLKQVHPFVSGEQRTKEGLVAFAEGCEAMELYPFAAHARWKLALIDSDNFQAHMKKFLDLIEKCGCKDADFFRKQFKFNEAEPANEFVWREADKDGTLGCIGLGGLICEAYLHTPRESRLQ